MDRMTAATLADQLASTWGARWSQHEQRTWIDAIERLDPEVARSTIARFNPITDRQRPSLQEFQRLANVQADLLATASRPVDPEFKITEDTKAIGRANIAAIRRQMRERARQQNKPKEGAA